MDVTGIGHELVEVFAQGSRVHAGGSAELARHDPVLHFLVPVAVDAPSFPARAAKHLELLGVHVQDGVVRQVPGQVADLLRLALCSSESPDTVTGAD